MSPNKENKFQNRPFNASIQLNQLFTQLAKINEQLVTYIHYL